MTESPLPNESITKEKKSPKLPRWLIILIFVVLVGVCCFGGTLLLRSIFKVNVEHGAYDIESVTLSGDLKDNQPVDVKDVFKPSDTIICTVKTTGVDGGVIGMRWFLGNQVVYEVTGKTQDNTISSLCWLHSSSVSFLGI